MADKNHAYATMGILTRRQGESFVISSDHRLPGVDRKRAARGLLNGPYHVWAGENWSPNIDDALTFVSLDEADEYVRADYGKVSA
jgi:hypothetical protein